MAWEIKSTNRLITTLIPIFLLLIVVMPQNNVSAIDDKEEYKTYESGYWYYFNCTAGSWVIVEIEDFSFFQLGDVRVKWTLKDASGNTVYVWKHEPDKKTFYYNPIIGRFIYTYYDKFDIQLPVMWWKEEGEWEIEGEFEATVSDFNPTVHYCKLNVSKGNVLDNLFAPIYIFNKFKIFGIETGYIQFKMFPIGYIVTVILIILLIILLVRYMKFAVKESKEIVKKSKTRIKEKLGGKV